MTVTMRHDVPTNRAGVAALTCSAYTVPTDQPEADGTLEWSSTTIVVVQAEAEGEIGTGWTYSGEGCVPVVNGPLRKAVLGSDAKDVPGINERMVRSCRNLGRPGLAGCAISATDMALWDLKSRLLGIPLTLLLGRCRTDVPVYGSGGFTTYSDDTTRAQIEHWVSALGLPRLKIKVGESWGAAPDRDLHRVALARRVAGDGTELFVDANGGYSVKQAVRMGHRFAGDHGVTWFEEPVSSDDLVGLRRVREAVAADVTAGEYGYDEPYFARMVSVGAVDCLQADVTRCGGFTSWIRAAAIAAAENIQISGHCAPALHTQVAASAPNLRHVEYFHDHVRIEALLFDGIPSPVGGSLAADLSAPGHGYTFKEQDAACFRTA